MLSKQLIGSMVIILSIGIITMAPLVTHALLIPQCSISTINEGYNGTRLSWSTTQATTVTLSTEGIVAQEGVIQVAPSTTTQYTVTAFGGGTSTTCTATVYPVTRQSSISYGGTYHVTDPNGCSMWVNPDEVVAGGTGILSWDSGSATSAWVDHGIGFVSTRASKVISNIGVPQTFTMTAVWGDTATRTCSATLYPQGTRPGYYARAGLIASFLPTVTVASAYSPTRSYIALNQVPYTGTNDIWYVLGLLAVLGGAMSGAYVVYKTQIASS